MSTLKKNTITLAYFFSEYFPRQGIDMWLEYGSALGAAREGGIIEGDHDIDMAIWWKDWGKFKEIMPNAPLAPVAFGWDFRTFPVVNYEPFPKGGEMCQIQTPNPDGSHPMSIDIYGLQEFDGIKCAAAHLGPDTKHKSKLYYPKNLKKIKFEGLDFLVSAYVEKYLDYRYKDAAGIGNTWRTPLTNSEVEKYSSMEGNIPCYEKEDEVTGCVVGVFDLFHIGHLRLLQRSSKIFDKVVAAVHQDSICERYKKKLPVIPFEHRLEILKGCKYVDEVITAPPPDGMEGSHQRGVDFLNENNLDYMIHSYAEQEFLDYHYASIIKEHRLFLLEETPDYHSSDLIKIISK